MIESNSLITVKQLPVIEENLRAFKAQIEEYVHEAVSLVCTEDTRKTVKSKRAELRANFDELETLRKGVKAQLMQPYDDFEAVYRECVAEPMKKADEALKIKIEEVESGIKQDKYNELDAYFSEVCIGLNIPDGLVNLEKLGVRVNLSTTVSSAKKKIVDQLNRINADLEFISGNDNPDEVMVEYRKTLNAITAVKTVEERHRQQDIERKKREAIRQLQQEKVEAAARVEEIAQEQRETEVINPPVVIDEPVQEEIPEQEAEAPISEPTQETMYQTSFKVTGTLDQLRALKAFLESEGISYESI